MLDRTAGNVAPLEDILSTCKDATFSIVRLCSDFEQLSLVTNSPKPGLHGCLA